MTRVVRVVLVIAALVAAAPTAAPAAGASTAVVVIDTGTNVRSAIIHFDGTINGIDALVLAGGNPTTYGFAGNGAAVCSIDGVGNPANESCLIGPNSEYWAYYLGGRGATSWSYSRGCACTTTVGDGDVQGWRYGTGAAPRSSADFCSYVGCAPATTVPSGGGGGGGTVTTAPATTAPNGDPVAPIGGTQPGGGSQPGSGTQPGGGPGPFGPASGSTNGAAGTAPASTVTSEPVIPTDSTTTSRPHNSDDERVEAAAVHRKGGGSIGGGGSGAGSPTGVLIAAGALAATAGIAVWLRRRRGALR